MPKRKKALLTASLILVLVFIVVRVAYHVEASREDPFHSLMPLGTDMRVYHDWATLISEGDWLSRFKGAGTWFDDWVSSENGVFTRPPLYAYFVAIIYWISDNSPQAVYLSQQVLGLATALLLLLLGARLWSLHIGLLASLVWTLYWVPMIYEMKLTIAPLLTLLTLASVFLVIRAGERQTLRSWMVAGVPIGLAILTRPNIAVFVALILLWVFLRARRGDLKAVPALLGWLAMVAVILVILLPVTARNVMVGDRLVLVSDNGGLNFFLGNVPGTSGGFELPPQYFEELRQHPEGQPDWFAAARPYITSDLVGWLGRLGRKTLLFWSWDEIPNNLNEDYMRRLSSFLALPWVPVGFLTTLGILGALVSVPSWRRLLPVHLIIVTTWSTIVLFFVTTRFRLPIMPLLALLAAYGLSWGWFAAKEKRWPSLLRGGACVLAIVLLFGVFRVRAGSSQGQWAANYTTAFAQAGDWPQAIREGERAIKFGTLTPENYAVLAVAYYNAGRVEDAGAAILTALSRSRAESVMATWQDFSSEIAARADADSLLERLSRDFPQSPELRDLLHEVHNAKAAQWRNGVGRTSRPQAYP